jgi:dienelactone hydrolase
MRCLAMLALAGCHQAASTTTDADLARDAASSIDPDARVPTGDATYDTDGPIAFTVTTEQIAANGHTVHATLYLPTSAGKHPLVAFSAGSTQTAAGYVPYGQRLASYGIAAIIEDDPGILTNTADIVPDDAYVVTTWVPANLGDQIDLTKVGLAGHSRGGAVSLLLAEHELAGTAVAWFGLDPVDNQFGQAPREYARTDAAALAIPTAFLGAQVASNCAPAVDGYAMLYPLVPAPSVQLVGVGAGHVQFETAAGCTGCVICSPNGTADATVVLAYAERYVTAFFARELLGDAHVGASFEGVLAPADVAAGRITLTAK